MKKLLLLFMILPVYSGALQHFCFKTYKYSTFPQDASIDQEKYHLQTCVVSVLMRELVNMGVKRIDRLAQIKEYLYSVNSPEALRLYADLEEMYL